MQISHRFLTYRYDHYSYNKMSIEAVEYCNNSSSDTHILLNRTDEYEFYETGRTL